MDEGQENTPDASEEKAQTSSSMDGDTGQGQASPPADTPKVPDNASSVKDLPDWAQKEIESLRKEAGDARVASKKTQELLDSVAKALGLKDEKPDPAKLAAELAASRSEQEDMTRQLAIYRIAPQAGGDPAALIDSRSFLSSIKDIDPSDTKKLEKAVRDAVQSNPKLATTRVVGKSGTESAGSGDGTKHPSAPGSLAEAVAQDLATH